MKKLIAISAVSAFVLAASPAFAAASTQKNLKITAKVPQECALEAPQALHFGNLPVDTTPGPDALLFPTSAGSGHGKSEKIWATCNYAASITLSSDNGGLMTDTPNTGPDSGDFTTKLNYTLSFSPSDNNAFAQLFLQTWNQTTNTKAQVGAFHDQANLGVWVGPQGNAGKRPLAGTYTDTAHITLGAI